MVGELANLSPEASGETRSSRMHWIALALVVAVHIFLLDYFLPFRLVFSNVPIAGDDLGTHLAQNLRFVEAMSGWGKTWSYDVQLLAGQPAGAIFDADNKAWELWVYAAMKVGLSFNLAANTFIFMVHVLVPAVVYGSARLFRVTPAAAVVSTALGVAIWYFDSFAHWCWWVGMVEYAFSAYLGLLPLALFYRYVQDRRRWLAVATAAALGVTLLVHPYTFFALAAPMVFLWLRDRSQPWNEHAWVVGIAAGAILINWWWLAVAFEFWPYIMDSAFYGQGGLRFLVADLFSTLLNTETSGHLSTRTGFRMFTWLTGLLMAAAWWRAGDVRGRVFVLAIGTMVTAAYLGSHVGPVAQVQPYRFVLPAVFLAVVPAGALCVQLAGALRSAEISRTGRTLALVLALPGLQHLLSDGIYFMPELQPRLPSMSDGRRVHSSGTGFAPHPELRYDNHVLADQVAAWVRENIDDSSRVLVEYSPMGDELAWRTKAQVLGGFPFRNLQHSWAHLYRREPTGVVPLETMRKYLQTYAVGWVILSTDRRWFGPKEHPLLKHVTKVGFHDIYRTTLDVNLARSGGGDVHADLNRIAVTGSDPTVDSVLRYHWMETLVCRPDCTVERTEVDGIDPVGFVRVPAPHPADFEIINGY